MKSEALSEFFKSEVHQDWHLFYEDPIAAVVPWAEVEPVIARQALSDLDGVLATGASEEELAELMCHEWGGSYWPLAEGGSARAWLAEMTRLLREALEDGSE